MYKIMDAHNTKNLFENFFSLKKNVDFFNPNYKTTKFYNDINYFDYEIDENYNKIESSDTEDKIDSDDETTDDEATDNKATDNKATDNKATNSI